MLTDVYCPISAAAKILQPKWNILILRSICVFGVRHFNELRRTLPELSPTLLAHRLKFFEEHGIINKVQVSASQHSEYVPTEIGAQLADVLLTMGSWGKQWINQEASIHAADTGLLVWVIAKNINFSECKIRKNSLIQLCINDCNNNCNEDFWIWLNCDKTAVLLDYVPNEKADLVVEAKKATLASCFMKYTTYHQEIENNHIIIQGKRSLCKSFPDWMGKTLIGTEKLLH